MTIGPGAATLGSAGIGAANSLLGGNSGADKAAKKAIQTEWLMYQQGREDYAPWRGSGVQALQELWGEPTMPKPRREDFFRSQYMNEAEANAAYDQAMTEWQKSGKGGLLREGPGEFDPETEPGYQFGYEKFVRDPYVSSQAVRGKRTGGETMKGLARYAQDYASQKYQSSYDRFLNRYYDKVRTMQTMAGMGQTAAGQTATLGSGAASGMSQALQAQGLARTEAKQDMWAGVGGALQKGMESYMDYKYN
jgi:hypothetical protein